MSQSLLPAKPGAIFLVAISYLYALAVVPPRLAILSLHLQTFGIHRPTKITCYALGAIILANVLIALVLLSVVCRPLTKLWDAGVPGQCVSINTMLRTTRVVNIVCDVRRLALPIPHVARLQMRLRMKIGILAAFGVGNIGLNAAIISLTKISSTSAVMNNTWSGAIILM